MTSSFSLLLHDVRRVAGVDLAVGTLMAADADHYVVDQLVGVTTDGLRNLRVAVGTGLGGKATLLAKPVQVTDYCRADGITHDYDDAVRGEQIRASFAVPIRVPHGPRGVIVGGLRREHVFGDRVLADVMTVVRGFERDLAEELALDRRLRQLRVAAGSGNLVERRRLVGICSELVHIASTMDNGSPRRQIEALVRRLTEETALDGLTAREREIIAEVAHGATNRQIAAKLGIGAETVKSSLRSSMRKLGVSNRAALVAAALL